MAGAKAAVAGVTVRAVDPESKYDAELQSIQAANNANDVAAAAGLMAAGRDDAFELANSDMVGLDAIAAEIVGDDVVEDLAGVDGDVDVREAVQSRLTAASAASAQLHLQNLSAGTPVGSSGCYRRRSDCHLARCNGSQQARGRP